MHGDLHFILPVQERVQSRLYPHCHTDMKANSTMESFGPKCMECTLVTKGHLKSQDI